MCFSYNRISVLNPESSYPMKTLLLGVLLALSLAANAALYWQRSATSAAAPDSSPNSAPAEPKARAATTKAAPGNTVATEADAARIAQVWANLQSSDLTTLVTRLRAAGFSPSMIRAIVSARLQEQFSARRAALFAQQEEQPFWKGQRYFDAKIMAGMRELQREQSALFKQLLGADGEAGNEEKLAYQRRQFGDLPRDKMDQMQSIIGDYGELRSQIYSGANGVMLPEDREKLALLEKEQRADLAALLTPQELENYELRSSATANNLRSQLALFNPTEEEFRAIFKLQQAFDEKYGSSNLAYSPDQFRQRQAQQKELQGQIKTVISPERVADYEQAFDPSYQMINRLVARLELPSSAATQVVSLQQEITKRAGTVRSDKTLSTEVRNMQLNALAQEASARLTTTLGTRGLEAYKQYGGQWMQGLAPRTQ